MQKKVSNLWNQIHVLYYKILKYDLKKFQLLKQTKLKFFLTIFFHAKGKIKQKWRNMWWDSERRETQRTQKIEL